MAQGAVSPAPSSLEHEKIDTEKRSASELGEISYDVVEERKLVRKIDWLLLPILTLLYLLSFLDRSNIGNAKVEGIVADLKLRDYPTQIAIFFVAYVLFEVPANLVLKKVSNRSPAAWLAFLTVLWGAIATAMGFANNEAALYAIRFLLGMAEAGLFPGIVYVFSRFYTRKERVARVAFFFSAAAAAGAFGGVLGYALTRLDGKGGQEGWRWLFQIEGGITILAGILAFFAIPAWPKYTKGLNEREKAIVVARLSSDSDAVEDEAFSWAAVRAATRDPFVYGYCLLFHGFAAALYTISTSLPAIIALMGYKSWQVQLLTIPPYFFAFVWTMFIVWLSQRNGLRAPFIITSAFTAILGYIVLLTSPTVGGRYTAVFLCCAGIYSGNALLLAAPSENITGQTKRATALAMQIALGDLGAIAGIQIYRIPLGSLANKNYKDSHIIIIFYLLVGAASAAGLWWGMNRANKKLDEEAEARKQRGEPSAVPGEPAWKENWRYRP